MGMCGIDMMRLEPRQRLFKGTEYWNLDKKEKLWEFWRGYPSSKGIEGGVRNKES